MVMWNNFSPARNVPFVMSITFLLCVFVCVCVLLYCAGGIGGLVLAIFHKLETSNRMKIVRECCPFLRRKEEEVGRGGGYGGEGCNVIHRSNNTPNLCLAYTAYS